MRFFISVVLGITIGIGGAAQGQEPKNGGPDRLLTIGLVPEQSIFKQIERYTPVTDYLSAKTGMKIRLKVGTQYGTVIDELASSQLDGAFLGSLTYVLAHQRTGVEVQARREGLDGSSVYHGLIFVRRDSGLTKARDWRRKRFAFVDKASLAGFLFPLVYFKKQGIESYETYFRETYFTGTHEDAIYDVLNGKADIGCAKNTVYNRLAEGDRRIREELKILTRSPDVPEVALALRKDLDGPVKKAIREVLMGMRNDPAGRTVLKNFGARQFVATTDEDYKPVFQYTREIQFDPARFNYLNK